MKNIPKRGDLVIFEDIKLLIHKIDENSMDQRYQTTILETNTPCIILETKHSQRRASPLDLSILAIDGRTGIVFSSEDDVKIKISS